jgi:hypothetical protein
VALFECSCPSCGYRNQSLQFEQRSSSQLPTAVPIPIHQLARRTPASFSADNLRPLVSYLCPIHLNHVLFFFSFENIYNDKQGKEKKKNEEGQKRNKSQKKK